MEKVITMPVLIAHNVMLQRNMLYVGITRERTQNGTEGNGRGLWENGNERRGRNITLA